jgi:hypothetical protein
MWEATAGVIYAENVHMPQMLLPAYTLPPTGNNPPLSVSFGLFCSESLSDFAEFGLASFVEVSGFLLQLEFARDFLHFAALSLFKAPHLGGVYLRNQLVPLHLHQLLAVFLYRSSVALDRSLDELLGLDHYRL